MIPTPPYEYCAAYQTLPAAMGHDDDDYYYYLFRVTYVTVIYIYIYFFYVLCVLA